MKPILFIFLVLAAVSVSAQKNSYEDSMRLYIQNYIDNHDVIKGAGKSHLRFYTINKSYRVVAGFEKRDSSPWFMMAGSGPGKSIFRVYGLLHFILNNTRLHLTIYQSQNLMQTPEYKNYLFIPFTDATSGTETYHGGRYIDISIADIRDNRVLIDFNKAYNPSCAYGQGHYSCPIPPAENHLIIPVKAGELSFGKSRL